MGKYDKNSVELSGLIVENPKYSHTTQGIAHYTMMVQFLRKSGASDIIPVCFTEKVFNPNDEYEGKYIELEGQFRSHNKAYGGKNHLMLYVYATYMNLVSFGNENSVTIEGYVCKKPFLKKKKSGYVLTEILIASNRINGKCDYVPCLSWMEQAYEAEKLEIGDRIRVTGRVQSRTYTKMLDGGENVERTTYEVSLYRFEKIEEGEEENESNFENDAT